MNMQAQLMMDQYLQANKDCLLEELYQNGLLTESGLCAKIVSRFAEEDAKGCATF